MKYYIAKKLSTDFDSAVSKAKEALKEEGFGVLSEINIHEKLKEKLDVDFRKYRILGACNPSLSHQALQKEDKVGTMLPCNVIVQQVGENEIEIAAVDPVISMQGIENDELHKIAKIVKVKLERVISSIN